MPTLDYQPPPPRPSWKRRLRPYGFLAVPFLAAVPMLALVGDRWPVVTVLTGLVLVVLAAVAAWVWWD
jgi:hypothetical protein